MRSNGAAAAGAVSSKLASPALATAAAVASRNMVRRFMVDPPEVSCSTSAAAAPTCRSGKAREVLRDAIARARHAPRLPAKARSESKKHQTVRGNVKSRRARRVAGPAAPAQRQCSETEQRQRRRLGDRRDPAALLARWVDADSDNGQPVGGNAGRDRKSTRLNSS